MFPIDTFRTIADSWHRRWYFLWNLDSTYHLPINTHFLFRQTWMSLAECTFSTRRATALFQHFQDLPSHQSVCVTFAIYRVISVQLWCDYRNSNRKSTNFLYLPRLSAPRLIFAYNSESVSRRNNSAVLLQLLQSVLPPLMLFLNLFVVCITSGHQVLAEV